MRAWLLTVHHGLKSTFQAIASSKAPVKALQTLMAPCSFLVSTCASWNTIIVHSWQMLAAQQPFGLVAILKWRYYSNKINWTMNTLLFGLWPNQKSKKCRKYHEKLGKKLENARERLHGNKIQLFAFFSGWSNQSCDYGKSMRQPQTDPAGLLGPPKTWPGLARVAQGTLKLF